MVDGLRFSDRKMVGAMKTSTKLLILKWLSGIFGLIGAGASIASVYFLSEVFAKVAPWSYPLLSLGAGVIAMLIVAALNGSKRRMAYMGQLMERGYTQAVAAEAWRTASNGGMNLLYHLQQTELFEQFDRLDSAIATPNGGGKSA